MAPVDMIPAMGTLLGFQLAAFTWRVNRELQLRKEAEEAQELEARKKQGNKPRKKQVENWFPLADWVNVLSMIATAFSMLVVLSAWDEQVALRLFRSALVLFMAYPFALLAHYRLFLPRQHKSGEQPYAPPLEWGISLVALISACGMFFCS